MFKNNVNEFLNYQLLEAMIAQNVLKIISLAGKIKKEKQFAISELVTPASVTNNEFDEQVFLEILGLEVPFSFFSKIRVCHAVTKYNELIKRI